MALTDKQRADLHAGIYDYLRSRPGVEFANCAEALAIADPEACSRASQQTAGDDADGGEGGGSPRKESLTNVPVLEKKWTAVPRLQRRVLELERQVASSARQMGSPYRNNDTDTPSSSSSEQQRRLLPRAPATHTLKSHSGPVTCVALHPIYTMTTSGSEDGTIKVWDYESGEYIRTLRGHTNIITGLDYSPKGTYLASSSTDLCIKIWNMSEGDGGTASYACVRTLRGHDHTISSVRFIPPNADSSFLLLNNSNITQQASSSEGSGGGGVDPALCGSKFIISASRDKTVKFWDVETGFCDHTLSDHSDWVRCIAVRSSSSSSSLGSGGGGGSSSSILLPALVATSGNDRTIYVYNANDKREKVCELRGHDHVVESLSFVCSSMIPRTLSTTSVRQQQSSATTATTTPLDYLASGSRDRTVRLWSIGGGDSNCLMTFRSHDNWVRCVLIHPSGNHILSCGDDRTIRVYDIKSNRCLRTIEDAHPHFVSSMAIHHSLPILVSGGVDHTVKCWQLV